MTLNCSSQFGGQVQLLQKRASPEVARFDGIKVTVYNNDHSEPHIHVNIAGRKSKLSLPDLVVLAGEPLSSSNRKKLEDWLATEVPFHEPKEDGTPYKVADWLADAFTTAINQGRPGKVWTPAEIDKQLRSVKNQGKKAHSHRGWDYWIEEVEPLYDYKLKVTFRGGEVKVVDIKNLCWGHNCFIPVFKNFVHAQNEGSNVWWPTEDNQVEIESEDLYLGRKPFERLAPNPDFAVELKRALKVV